MTPVRALAAIGALLASGCGYVIEGRVVQTDMPTAGWTPSDDLVPGAPVHGATVTITRDPDRLSREVVATAVTQPDGSFALSIGGFGTGWMDEDWLIVATAPRGRGGAIWRGPPPSSPSGRLLIFGIAPGGADAGANPWDSGAYQREDAAKILDEMKRYR
jgi:hypothetical protein